MKTQHARPLAHKRVSELWLGYTPVGTDSGFRIHFEIFRLHNCGWRSSMLVPLFTRE
jgi:hypothetical protein